MRAWKYAEDCWNSGKPFDIEIRRLANKRFDYAVGGRDAGSAKTLRLAVIGALTAQLEQLDALRNTIVREIAKHKVAS